MSRHASATTTPLNAPGRRGAASRSAASAFAFDLDGTIYLDSQLLPGARELVERMTASGVRYVFATNNSSRSGEQHVQHVRALGIAVARHDIVTSNDVAIAFLQREGLRRPYLIATPEVEREYRAYGLAPTDRDPDCVLLTFDTTLTYDKLRVASRFLRSSLPYLATHPDRTCPMPEGPIPDCGSFIALLEAATGERPIVLGKPEAPMARTIQARLARQPHEIAFVGDRLYTDVRMANDHGFQAILTLTGDTRREDLGGSEHRPDLVVDSLAALRELLEASGTFGARP